MQEEIKYRTWDGVEMDYDPTVCCSGLEDYHVNQAFTDKEGTDKRIWMQSTGLKDKDGTEIWMGDVIQVFYHLLPETDENKAYTVIIEYREPDYFGVGYGKGKVLGNIYQNPELVKQHDEE